MQNLKSQEMLTAIGPHEKISCKDCAYNRGNGKRGDCDMFEVMKPDKIYFDGEECPLYLKNSPRAHSGRT